MDDVTEGEIVEELTDGALEERYIECILQGDGPHVAARKVGTTDRLIRLYMAARPEFELAVEAAKAERIDAVERVAFDAALDRKEPWAIQMILRAQRPEVWAPSNDINLNVRQGELGEADIEALHRRLAAAPDPKELTSGDE